VITSGGNRKPANADHSASGRAARHRRIRPACSDPAPTAAALGNATVPGYVVAAGSTVDGRPYTVLADREPAPLPDWIADRLTPAADHTHRPAAPVAAPVADGRLPAYLRAALTREAARVTAAAEGSRNHTLYVAAVALGQLVAGGALPAELVAAELEQAAATVGLDLGEAAGTIRSGLRAGARRPRRPGQAAA
jgi:hypothetical protein